jgi:hypothetical protein
MTDYSWFRLLLKGIAVLLLGLSIPMLLWTLGALVAQRLASGGIGAVSLSVEWLPSIIGYGSQAAIGLYLLLAGQQLIDYCLRGVRGRCPACGYNVEGLSTTNCPECATPIPRQSPPAPRVSSDKP